MSFSRENVIWQSKDKTWSIGFWSFYETGSFADEDYDPEWDVEYSNDSFWFVSTGHATQDAAAAAYTRQHANPGGHWIVEYSTKTAKEIAQYNEYAWAFKNPEAAEKKQHDKFRAEVRTKQKAIIADLTERNITNFAGITYSATFKKDHNWAPITRTDRCVMKNGWVCLGDKRVYNPTTKKFAADVIDFKFQQPSRGYGGYGYGGYGYGRY